MSKDIYLLYFKWLRFPTEVTSKYFQLGSAEILHHCWMAYTVCDLCQLYNLFYEAHLELLQLWNIWIYSVECADDPTASCKM